MLKLLNKYGYFPRSCVWELTLKCNLQCKHCGSRAGKARTDELNKEQLLNLCDEMADLGVEKVTLSGGEPTLHPHWLKITRRLSKNGIRANIISNGLTWNRQLARKAKKAGLRTAAFSLDGFEQSHNYIRGVEHSWKNVLSAFAASRAENLHLSVVTTIYKHNMKELPQLKNLLQKEGVAFWQIQIGNPAGNMADNKDLVLEPRDLLEIIPLVAELKTQKNPPLVFPGDNLGYYGKYEEILRENGGEIDFWVGCRAGLQVLGIESNGNVKGCLSLPSQLNREDRFSEGNIKDNNLTDIWCNPDNFSYNRNFSLDNLGGFCRTCKYNEICRGGCIWTSFSHSTSKLDNPMCYYRVAVENGIISI
ncbi:MAG: radical SAM protein [Myxococcota bacterium]